MTTSGWAWVVCAISLALAASALRTRWSAPAAWLALALAGQAGALQLIDAPPWDVYQHYFPWRTLLTPPRSVVLTLLLVQAVVVAARTRRYWPAWREFVARVPARRWLALLGLLAFASALGSENIPQYGVELALTASLSLVGMLNLFLVAAAAPGADLERIARWLRTRFDAEQPTTWNRALPWIIAGWVVAASASIAVLVFDRVPLIQDSVSYLFQAKYFSVGRLYLPPPPDAASFDVSHIINDGTKWYAYGFPGWPAVLAVGVLAGAPWLVNPLLAGLFVLIAHALVRRLYGWHVAHGAVLLLATSPWFLFLSASHMPHTVTIVWAALGWLAIERARSSTHIGWGLLCGVSLAGVLLTRPLEGVLVGSVLGLTALGIGGARLPVRSLAALVVACVAVSSLIFPYNKVLTGDPLYPPQAKFRDTTAYPGADRFGFGADVGNLGWPHLDPLPGHGAADVVINLNRNLYQTNVELFGWTFGCLLIAALPLLWRRTSGPDRLLIAFIVVIAGGQSFYWFSGGPDFGARYWFQMLLPLVVLTVRGIELLHQELGRGRPGASSSTRVAGFVAVACLMSIINFIPWRSFGKYHRYRLMTADVQRLAEAQSFGRSLVFVRVGDTDGGAILNTTDYPSAFVFNPSTLESDDTIYAFDAGAAHRRAVEEHFAGRPVWVIGRFPSDEERAAGIVVSDRMRVLEGPQDRRDESSHPR